MNVPRGPFAAPGLIALLLLAGCAEIPSSVTPPRSSNPPAPAATPAPGPAAAPAPEVPAVQEPAAQASREGYSPRQAVEIPVDRARMGAAKRAELWGSADGGRNWTNHGEFDAARETVPWLAPRDGRYGFHLVPLSADGKRETTPRPGDAPERTIVVDTAAPVVELLAPNGGEMLGAGRSTIVRWAAVDPNLAPAGIRIEVGEAGGPWTPVARDLPNSGQYHWDIGAVTSPRLRLRVVARDLAGNTGMDVSDNDFVIDGMAPDLRITGPGAANEVPVLLQWAGGDLGGSGLKRVSLYVTRDQGQTWRHHGDDEDLQSPYLFQDLDGAIGLRLVAEDRMGNLNPVPVGGMPPQAVLVLDRTKPEVKLLSPQGGGYHAGVAVDVLWTAKDNVEMPANGVSLFYSDDAGKTWKEIARGVKNDGLYKWAPPRRSGTEYRLKIAVQDVAGNLAEVLSDRFGIDEAIPEAWAVAPDGSNSHTVQVHYEIKNKGSAPIRKVTLYYRPEGMKEWLKYGEDPDAVSPVTFAKADGTYGVYVTGATESGLKSEFVQKAPEEGVEPQLKLRIDATPPQVSLETFGGGGYVMAGIVTDIQWKMLEANPDPRGMNIYYSPDGGGSWNVVAVNVDPTKGGYRWTVPAGHGNRHKIRLVALDAHGNKGVAESEHPFAIDADLPSVSPVELPPPVIRGDRLRLRYKAADLTSGIDRVLLYGRPVAEKKPYQLLSESKNVEGEIDCTMPVQGGWAFVLVAVDAAGQVSSDPAKNPKPDFVVGFDKTKPQLAIKRQEIEKGKVTFVNQSWEVEWTATDAYSPADRIGVRIERSSDNGKTWTVAVARHPNSGKADLRPFLDPGKHYRVRLIASDEAGNEAEDTSDDFDPGQVPPPPLALRGIDEGRRYVVGTTVSILWATPDRTIREATLELSRDAGKTWTSLATLHTTSTRLPLPEKEGRYMLRAVARDVGNRQFWSNAVTFEVISGVEQVRVIANASVEAGKLLRVHVEPRAIFGTARELRLEIFDGKEWRRVDDVKKQDLAVGAPTQPGEYAIRVAVVGADGKEYTSNEPRFMVTPRDLGAALQLLNFRGDKVYAGGTRHPVMLKTEFDAQDLVFELSEAGGREGTWRGIPGKDLEIAAGRIFWRLPAITNAHCRLRVSHKDPNERVAAVSENDFGIESQKPLVTVVAPSAEVAPPVKLEYRADKSIAPLKLLKLYVSKNEGRTWTLHKAYDAGVELLFAPVEPGDYGLYLIAENEAGLSGEAPPPGTVPQATVKVRGKAVQVAPPVRTEGWPKEYLSPLPATIKGGTEIDGFRWSVEGAGKVTLLLVVDGKEQVLAADQPAAGSVKWSVPKVDRKGCRVLLRAGDRRIESPVFEIDSSAPAIEGIEIEIPRR